MSTDTEWEKWAKIDPYYGVLTDDKYRSNNLTSEALKEFFQTGKRDIEHVFETVKHHFDHSFSPRKALEFGCGTGRLVIPLSKIAKEVIGVDVSDSMLKEANINCMKHSITNVRFMKADNALSILNESFDFIHSYIVFQHIPVKRGRFLISKLIDCLEEGGICAIQLTYANARFNKSFGKPPLNLLRSIVRYPKRFLTNILSERTDPLMEMNNYILDEILFIMQEKSIQSFFTEFTNHGGELGVYLYFCKSK